MPYKLSAIQWLNQCVIWLKEPNQPDKIAYISTTLCANIVKNFFLKITSKLTINRNLINVYESYHVIKQIRYFDS